MRLFNFRKSSLIFICMLGIAITLVLLMLSVGIISIKSVSSLGKYSNSVNDKNIKKSLSNIVLENTKQLAKGYSSIFQGAESYTKILVDLTRHYLDVPDYYIKPDRYSAAVLGLFKEDSYFINSDEDNVSICYWGTKEKVPENVEVEIRAISYLSRLVFAVNSTYPYVDEIWVNNYRDEYLISSPHFAKVINKSQLIRLKKRFHANYVKYIEYYKKNPEKKTEPIWIGPRSQLFEDRRDLTVKYPIFDRNKGCFIGFAELDIDVDDVVKKVLKQQFNGDEKNIFGYSFLLTDIGTVVAMPKKIHTLFDLPSMFYIETDNLFFNDTYTTKLIDSKQENVRKLAKELIGNKQGVTTLNINNESYFIAYTRIPVNNWIVISILPMKQLLLPIKLTSQKMQFTVNKLLKDYILIAVVFLIIALLILFIFFWYLINVPIRKLRKTVKRIGEGNFDVASDVKGSSEISDLSDGINQMRCDLIKYTDNLEKETKKNQAIETELEIAVNIQKSVIPKITGDLIRNEFELYAKLIPAKEMSGDFYDLFYVADDTVALVIADVSGKGISAAFFMSMSRVVIKNTCTQAGELDPGKILYNVNKTLFKDNDTGMFLTMYLMFYNIKTGKLIYANGGHHNMIYTGVDGRQLEFGILGNTPVGMFDNQKYDSSELTLKIGDSISVYTDGICEAPNTEDIQYGDDKVIEILKTLNNKELKIIGDSVIEDVIKHEAGKRFDDITLLMLRRKK
jgi:serine phosphatase RsbU (regulator of sigma subunit)